MAPLNMEGLFLLTPLEGFASMAKLSLWIGITLSSPLCLYWFLNFLLPALRPREKRILIPFFSLSFVFTLAGILFAYKITLPLVILFFEQFSANLGTNLWSLGRTIDLLLGLIFAHGLVFEFYVILLFLIRFDFLSYDFLKKIRKFVIVAIFILAAILTPPDVLSQLLLAFPMLILFETAIFYAKIKSKKKTI